LWNDEVDIVLVQLTKEETLMKISRRLAATLSVSAVALGSAFFSSAPAFAATGVTNTTGVWEVCDSSDPTVDFTVEGPLSGEIVALWFSKFDDVATYTTSKLSESVVLGNAVVGTVYSYSVEDVAALAQQEGITEWPLEVSVGLFPAGTTDFINTQSIYDYAAFGVEDLGSVYGGCTKPVLPEAPPAAEELPNTGTNVDRVAIAGIAATALLSAGGLVLLVQRRRKSL
jgi:LPXTG-motif cell wall-anchored protein